MLHHLLVNSDFFVTPYYILKINKYAPESFGELSEGLINSFSLLPDSLIKMLPIQHFTLSSLFLVPDIIQHFK